jgi:hypothetical protein
MCCCVSHVYSESAMYLARKVCNKSSGVFFYFGRHPYSVFSIQIWIFMNFLNIRYTYTHQKTKNSNTSRFSEYLKWYYTSTRLWRCWTFPQVWIIKNEYFNSLFVLPEICNVNIENNKKWKLMLMIKFFLKR